MGSYVIYYCYLDKKTYMSVEEILQAINNLTLKEQEQILQNIIDTNKRPEQSDIFNIREGIHERNSIECPYCKSRKWIKFGSYRDSQKYRCSECRRTFTSLTGSSAYRIHDKEKWTKYFSCLLGSYSLHKCASEVGISYKTSFNWRHKILRSFRDIGHDKLTVVIEADETYFLDSKKGQKVRGRKPRKRGGVGAHGGPTRDHISVVVAADRSGRMALRATGKSRPTSQDIVEALGRWVEKKRNLSKKTIFCTDQYSAYCTFARKKNLLHKQIPGWDRKWTNRRIYHLQHVNNVHSKLKKWIRQFNGVSSKYLPNYLIYFKIKEIVKDFKNQEDILLKYSLKYNNTYLPANKFHRHFIKQYYCT
jgi:transposase-like protein